MRREPLPIDDVLPQIVEKVTAAGAVVLKAPPGAGKTTRVAPALLDAGVGDLDGGKSGQIVVLQPRRVAARAAATRISEERSGEVGEEVGYQVRHERRVSPRTRIVVCTEGVFLRRLQEDPLLENVAAVVFDEFHERSIDSDLALAMVRQVWREVRPDLRIVVMSATLEPAPISKYLYDCPTVESLGRAFPVDIEYLRFASNAPLDRMVADGVRDMLSRTAGHVLVFLPGVGEIRQAQATLDAALPEDIVLAPLYGDMPLDEQQRVLRPSRERKVVLATNVAETSLTIDGVTAVVDSGLARINRLDPDLGLNRLETARISRASADQRAGRAGRTAPGSCVRLWLEREQLMLREFELPEVARVELSECVLQLLAWGENDVRAFPWYESPPQSAIDQALLLLDRLDALNNGALTELGKRMARFPLQPRLARLLLEGERFNQSHRAALCASLLSEREPFRRSGPRAKAEHHSDSDVGDRLWAIEEFERSGQRDSVVGEIVPGAAKQILRGRAQLVRLLGDKDEQVTIDARALKDSEAAVRRALLAAFPDRVCKLREPNGRRALMVGGRGVRLADESALADAELFVAIELIATGQSESLVRQASSIERSWLPESHVSTSVDVGYDSVREKVMALKRTRFCDLILSEAPAALPADVDASAALAAGMLAQFSVDTLVSDEAKSYVARLQFLRQHVPELELPDFADALWHELIVETCVGCASVAEFRAASLVSAIQSRLTHQQVLAIEQEAPDRIEVPSGSRIKIEYEPDRPPVLAVRIQELFGMPATPRIARSRVPVLLHLLAPNYRIQQITPDLASFWKNTYTDVKKELKQRYPKHSWPDDPLSAEAIRGPKKRQ